MQDLDNPILRALETTQARYALAEGGARRFIPEIGPLAGFSGPAGPALEALLSLTAPGQTIGLFLPAPLEGHAGWDLVKQGALLQMIRDAGSPPQVPRPVLELSAEDAPEMLELAALAKPGPFERRTHELGRFVGVREGGRLAAMVGERLRLPGFTEVSAVCTHPDHLGRGHAAALLAAATRRILERGETPFLHVLPGNARAISLYERLGFCLRARLSFAILRRPQ